MIKTPKPTEEADEAETNGADKGIDINQCLKLFTAGLPKHLIDYAFRVRMQYPSNSQEPSISYAILYTKIDKNKF